VKVEAQLKEKVCDINIQKFRPIKGEQLWSLLIGVLRFLWVVFVLV